MSRCLILSLPMLALAACSSGGSAGDGSVDINAAAMQAQNSVDAYAANTAEDDTVEVAEPGAARKTSEAPSNALAPLDPPAPGTPGGLPDDRTPLSEAPFTPDSAQGAANVVQTYFALLAERKYEQAFALREAGAPGLGTVAALAADLARYSEYHANVGGPSAIDAGAGQRYVTVPVQVYARLKQSAAPVYQIGSVMLHRVGDVDGASAAQRAWHIREIDLKATP